MRWAVTGVAQARRDRGVALDIRSAVDFDADALGVLATNFPKARTTVADLGQALGGREGDDPTPEESRLFGGAGAVHLLVAGPSCQGHVRGLAAAVDPATTHCWPRTLTS